MPIDAVTTAVRQALRHAPCSTRALAKEAGVPHSTLVRIVAGSRNATAAVGRKVARALYLWAERCEGLANAVAEAAKVHGKGD